MSAASATGSVKTTKVWLGPDRHFDHAVLPLAKEFIGFSNAVQGKRVGQERPQVQPAVTNELHQAAHPLLPSGTQSRHDFVIAKTGRERL